MIYLDHFASSPLSTGARAAMAAALEARGHGNASSVHAAGRAARAAIEHARHQVARAVGASAREIVFTSGGTEAVHLAVLGAGEHTRAILVDPGAHPSLRAACAQLAATRGIPIEPVPIRAGGAIRLDALDARLAALAAPALLAIASVQHETGALAPLDALDDLVRTRGTVLVLDAIQALGRAPVALRSSSATAAAFSAHKIGGPPGVGATWFASHARPTALLRGGAQERGLRAGSENTLGIVGFGAAADEVAPRWLSRTAQVARARDVIESALRSLDDVVINGSESPRVAFACHASVAGVAGEELVAALDLAGFCVSSGPACSSGRPGSSESMQALYPDEPWRAASSLRITLGPDDDPRAIERFVAALPDVIARVRAG